MVDVTVYVAALALRAGFVKNDSFAIGPFPISDFVTLPLNSITSYFRLHDDGSRRTYLDLECLVGFDNNWKLFCVHGELLDNIFYKKEPLVLENFIAKYSGKDLRKYLRKQKPAVVLDPYLENIIKKIEEDRNLQGHITVLDMETAAH